MKATASFSLLACLVAAHYSPSVGANDGDSCDYNDYVPTYDEPTELSRLSPGNQGTAGGYFGWSVALAGSTAVVGAQKGKGAYVIDRSWGMGEVLTPSYPEEGDPEDGFGYSVAVTTSDDGAETVIAVGSTKDAAEGSNGGLDKGAVYIFKNVHKHIIIF